MSQRNILEALASLEHDRWSRWHIHQAKNANRKNTKRWDRQAVTPYDLLTEKEKASDRREARRTLKTLRALGVEV